MSTQPPPLPAGPTDDEIVLPLTAARGAVFETPAPERRSLNVGFDTEDWRNWAIFAAGITVVGGGLAASLGQTGAPGEEVATHMQFTAGAVLGGMLFVVLLPAVLMAIAARVSKGRIAKAARSVVACIALVMAAMHLMGIVVGMPRMEPPPRPAAAATFKPLLAQQAAQAADGEGASTPAAAVPAPLPRKPRGAAEQRSAVAGAARDFAAYTNGAVAPLVDAMQRLELAGGMDIRTLADEESLTKRITIIRDARPAADAALRTAKTLADKAREIALSHGASTAEADQFVRGVTSGGKLDRFVRVREIDVALFSLMDAYLTTLQKTRGRWTVVDGMLETTDPKLLTEVGAVVSRIEQLAAEQNRLTDGPAEASVTPK
ncbi:MAG TPA: hypothetical protein VEB22_11900 [Phycisphaerales bacterium]|nr:hypothetical protein [Phycisphaerales bacterium]